MENSIVFGGSFLSCNQGIPLAKLGNGNAAELNYNLPQSSCFSAKGYISVGIPNDYWRPELFQKPQSNFFFHVKDLTQGEIRNIVYNGGKVFPGNPWSILSIVSQKQVEEIRVSRPNRIGIGKDYVEEANPVDSSFNFSNSAGGGLSSGDLISQIQAGLQPIKAFSMYGRPIVKFMREPVTPKPKLVISLEYRVCSFLGDYGAGKTVKTFSLLPGEKTEIAIKTYKHTETTRTRSENVLDSFSESSTQELEQMVQLESSSNGGQDITDTVTNGVSESETGGHEIGGGLTISGEIKGIEIGLNGNASTSGGATTTNTSGNSHTVNSYSSEMVSNLESAMDKQVSISTAVREISINTEVSESIKEGTETSTVRKLENINYSRVLNFVFRQLLQEYLTITYLENVRFVYTNGYQETKVVTGLEGLPGLLASLFQSSTQANAVLDAIMAHLCNISDYEGVMHSFVEHISEQIESCCGSGSFSQVREYCRKRKGLAQTWNGITVPGIIVSTKRRILPTDSVICEALLGQGEALDCYNQKLQDAATIKAQLENRRIELENAKIEQAIRILDLIDDPQLKAEMYKKVFSDCCDVPQSGCGCQSNI